MGAVLMLGVEQFTGAGAYKFAGMDFAQRVRGLKRIDTAPMLDMHASLRT